MQSITRDGGAARALVGTLVTLSAVAACGPSEELAMWIPGDDGAGTPAAVQSIVASIGPEGGELVGPEGTQLAGFRLVVPPGALDSPVELEVHGTIDGTPLPETAAAIGAHFEISPAGVTFAVPARATLPFDLSMRGAWDTPDEECRVWYRDGDAWSRADAVEASPTSVTVELSATTTAGAGVTRGSSPIGCRFDCTRSVPGPTCMDGDRFCLTRVGQQHVGGTLGYYGYSKGAIYWLTAPSSGSVAIAGFDVVSRAALGTTGNATGLSGTPVGDIVVDDEGAIWLGFRHRANVRFQVGRLATLFDAFATSTQPRAIGVGFDQASRSVVRLRTTIVPPSGGRPQSQTLSAVRDGATTFMGEMIGAIEADGAHQIGRSLSMPPTTAPFLVYGGRWGVAAFGPPAAFQRIQFPVRCGVEAPRDIFSIAAAPGRFGYAFLCRDVLNRGAIVVNGGVRQSFEVGQIPSGRIAADGDGGAFLADSSRPQVTRFTRDGGATVIPLTTATDTTSAAYTSMIPSAIFYDTGLDALYLVTRGTAGTPEFWQVDALR